jgi:GT2 family glycosyltransferase
MELGQETEAARRLEYRPLLSILTPVFNPLPSDLRDAINSVLEQTYDRWELCLVDGGSDGIEIRQILERYAEEDARIRVRYLDRNLGISGNSNAALEMASGEFVVLLDHDDTLAPSALSEVAHLLNQNREWDVIYSDHDVLAADGTGRFAPLFKPDWSPETMLSANYATHLTVVRTATVREVGGFHAETDGAQDWDLLLRISQRTQRIAHIPKILYHWRNSRGSTATSVHSKPYAAERQLMAIERHLAHQGLENARAFFDVSGFIRVSWDLVDRPVVSIIIPSNGANHLLQTCVESIFAETAYSRLEIVVVNNGARRPEQFDYYQRLSEDGRVRIIHYDGSFNFSAVCNLGARHSTGDLVLFLNNDIRVLTSDWLDELVLWAQRKDIGVVGAKLLAPDRTIQHAGVIMGLTGFAGHVFAGSSEGQSSIFGFPEWYRNLSAVTGACMMLRREVFEEVGGFNEEYLLCGSDVMLCLRIRSLGYRILYDPFVRLEHLGSATHQGGIPLRDFEISLRDYHTYLEAGDPYFNPNLSCCHLYPTLRPKGEASPLNLARHIVGELRRECG